MAIRTTLWASVLCGVLSGCGSFEPPEPGPDHPAGVEAAPAAPAPLPDVLTVEENDLPRIPPEMRRDRMHHGHGDAAPGPEGGAPPPAGGRYACPMHPETASDRPARCPRCGMEMKPTGGRDER